MALDVNYWPAGTQIMWREGSGPLGTGALPVDTSLPHFAQPVTVVRADLGGNPFDVETFQHEGGTYYVLEVPPGTTTFTIDYLVDGQVLAPPRGESAEHVMPDE